LPAPGYRLAPDRTRRRRRRPPAEAISLPAGKGQVSPNYDRPEGTLPEDLR